MRANAFIVSHVALCAKKMQHHAQVGVLKGCATAATVLLASILAQGVRVCARRLLYVDCSGCNGEVRQAEADGGTGSPRSYG